jgi:hypothetical protein
MQTTIYRGLLFGNDFWVDDDRNICWWEDFTSLGRFFVAVVPADSNTASPSESHLSDRRKRNLWRPDVDKDAGSRAKLR